MRYSALVAAALLISPGLASAQQNSWSLSINPRFGYFASDKPLGYFTPDGPTVEMPAAATAGLTVELGTPYRFLALRATAQSTLNAGLARKVPTGFTSCGTGCASMEHESHPIAQSGSLLNLSMDAVIRPAPASWRYQPYGVLGAGLKRYDLGRGVYNGDPQSQFGGRSAGLAINTGAGIDVPLGKAVLNIEVVDYVSGFSRASSPQSSLSQKAFTAIRHDLFMSLGFRVNLFGN